MLGACHRIGSLDSDIRAAEHNDFSRLRALAPDLTQVLFNGQAAGRFASRFEAAGYVVRVLPSTSPANARLRFEDKLAAWRAGAPWGDDAASANRGDCLRQDDARQAAMGATADERTAAMSRTQRHARDDVQITLSEQDGIRYLHFGSEWVQGAMKIRQPDRIVLDYVRQMMGWMLFLQAPRELLQLGLGAGALTRFCVKHLPDDGRHHGRDSAGT